MNMNENFTEEFIGKVIDENKESLAVFYHVVGSFYRKAYYNSFRFRFGIESDYNEKYLDSWDSFHDFIAELYGDDKKKFKQIKNADSPALYIKQMVRNYITSVARTKNAKKNHVNFIYDEDFDTIEDSKNSNSIIELKTLYEDGLISKKEYKVILYKVFYNYTFSEMIDLFDDTDTIGQIQSFYYRIIKKLKKLIMK